MKRTVPDGKNAADGEISVNDVRVFQVAGPRVATGGLLWREGRRHGMLRGRLYAMMACRSGVPVSRVTGFPVPCREAIFRKRTDERFSPLDGFPRRSVMDGKQGRTGVRTVFDGKGRSGRRWVPLLPHGFRRAKGKEGDFFVFSGKVVMLSGCRGGDDFSRMRFFRCRGLSRCNGGGVFCPCTGCGDCANRGKRLFYRSCVHFSCRWFFRVERCGSRD